jgi:hypothetical protein
VRLTRHDVASAEPEKDAAASPETAADAEAPAEAEP